MLMKYNESDCWAKAELETDAKGWETVKSGWHPCPATQQEPLHGIAGILPSTITDQASHIFHLSKQKKNCYFLFEILGNSARINSLILFEQVWFYILSVCFVLHYKLP